jgi:hypothetical protein
LSTSSTRATRSFPPGIVDSHVHINEPGRTDGKVLTRPRAYTLRRDDDYRHAALNSVPATTGGGVWRSARRWGVSCGRRLQGVVPGNIPGRAPATARCSSRSSMPACAGQVLPGAPQADEFQPESRNCAGRFRCRGQKCRAAGSRGTAGIASRRMQDSLRATATTWRRVRRPPK